MDVKFSKVIFPRVIALLLCFYIGIYPFFQPKKVQASPALVAAGIGFAFAASGIGWGWFRDMNWTSEQVDQINAKCTENLKAAFPDPAEYNEQMNILQNINGTLLNGGEVDWSKYGGKLIYAISKAVIDVLYPTQKEAILTDNEYFFSYYYDGYITWKPVRNWVIARKPSWPYRCVGTNYATGQSFDSLGIGEKKYHHPMTGCVDAELFFYGSSVKKSLYFCSDTYYFKDEVMPIYARLDTMDSYCKNVLLGGNGYLIPNISKKTATKVKLPTRLPQSVINNYNTYINGDSENLVISPTDNELPTLPDNYNPATDDPPDLDGYQDVTPDQEPTDTPDPTPTPTPTPSTPDYDGSSWLKPIGDFFAGLLSFLKDALIPTQTVDFSPLQNMGTDFGKKFPFSLPGDIGKLFGVLQAESRRPEFQMTFDLSKVGVPGDPIVWDLKFEQWDGAAAIVKTALYIGFLIGLVFISKNFMKN
ncbi:hypothetical protein [Eubacterium callanderi]|uniref:hypothetical protein n=1 Tax=Eubacterium callanderi TaxID=53442 RepID=UPI00391C5D71